MAGAEQRARAADAVFQVRSRRRTLDQVQQHRALDPLETELVYGVIRHVFSLSKQVESCLDRGLKERDQDLFALLLVGAYQLQHSRIPAFAAINETVSAVRVLRKDWARGLVNAVLRKLTRTVTDATADPAEAAAADHPAWLRDRLHGQYESGTALMAANQTRAPLCLRVNQRRIAPAAYLEQLRAAGLDWEPGAGAEALDMAESLILKHPQPASTLPGWQAGLVAVQDGGAQLAAPLLGTDGPHRLLDACAAPGGKLAHYLERFPAVHALGIDLSGTRLTQTRAQLDRLGHAPALQIGDATELGWWDGEPFDRILLDAPCSGTGTLRRHPDIKVLRRAADIAEYQALQRRMLGNLWQVLKPGGKVLYCTCTVLEEENDQVVEGLLASEPSAAVEPLNLPTGLPRRLGWQLLPTDKRTDGFYFALIGKRAS